MKKIISIILTVVMLVLSLGASADNSASEKLEKVLVAVKSKIDVPAELTEFSSYVSERNGKSYYNFEWADEQYNNSMSVSCDGEGRIISYYNYRDISSEKKISSFSKNEIIAFASEFVSRTLPETVRGEGDVLVYDEVSYDARSNMRYSMRFDRKKESVKVKDNYAEVTVCETDGKLSVRSMNVSYDYETEFDLTADTVSDYTEKYMSEFPAELIYRNEYSYNSAKGQSVTTPVLVYRIKDDNIGYIDAVTGEPLTEDASENEVYKEESFGATQDSASGGGGSRNEVLTPQEIDELEKIEGLLSISDIEKAVKKLPYVKLTDDMTLTGSELSKYEEDYFYSVYYTNNSEEDYRYIRINADAKSGKILSLYANSGISDGNKTLSESEIKNAESKIAEFLNAAAKDETAQCEAQDSSAYRSTVDKYYVRIVNGIKYIGNGISVSFNAEKNCVESYNLNFTESELENPENAIGEDAAYEKILEYAPIIPLCIKSGGVYKKVFTLDCNGIQLDAVTGKIMNGYGNEKKNYSYTDISGHWAEEAAQKLAEIQVGFEGDTLNPEKEVTQAEFLRFTASAILNKYYAEYSDEEIYKYLIRDGIVKEEEKNPDSFVTREQAFVYIIRFAKLEKVAELSDIYKVSYADGHLLSDGKIGYAAILTGLGIICGDGGYLRPTENLTRAEGIVMVYRYLLNI